MQREVKYFIPIFPRLAQIPEKNLLNSPPVQRWLARKHEKEWGMQPEEILRPSLPLFVDLEITTACQLRCPQCARTFLNVPARHMALSELKRLLEKIPQALHITIVGLGEPLLHPELGEILKLLKKQQLRVSLVTNVMELSGENTQLLTDVLLDSITFSLDSTDPKILARMRPGARLSTIVRNIEEFMAVRASKAPSLSVSLFCVLRQDTVSGLADLSELAAQNSIPAIIVSDLNFAENHSLSLSASSKRKKLEEDLWKEMRRAASYGVVLLRPNILDEVVPDLDWPYARLTDPKQLFKNGHRHEKCLAPWRTLVVRVDGSVNFCNCTPLRQAGNLVGNGSLKEIWKGRELQEFRKNLYYGPIPAECRVCPRL